MKKLLILAGLVTVCSLAKAQLADRFLAGTLTTPTSGLMGTNNGMVGWATLITTNRANVHSVQLSSASTGVFELFDCGNTNAPFFGINFTNRSYWTTTATNGPITNIYVSPLTGTTNIFTNIGTYTFYVTNAIGTNSLSSSFASAFTANIAIYQSGLNLTFAQGICAFTSTNVNYSIGYTP